MRKKDLGFEVICPEQSLLNGVGSELTFSMELEDVESNKKRRIEEAKETERLLPFRSTEEEKDSTTSSFDTAVQGDETAVIDKGAAVIDNKEGVVLEEKELDTEDDVKVAADPNLLEHAKKSEHDSKVLLAEQRSSEQRRSQVCCCFACVWSLTAGGVLSDCQRV